MSKQSALNLCFNIIKSFYGERTTMRFPAIPLISHINEGLIILDNIGASNTAMAAFCIHPLLQDDDQNIITMKSGLLNDVPAEVIITAMHYRAVANEHLNIHNQKSAGREYPDHAWICQQLECYPDVRDMLIADKVQNKHSMLKFRTNDSTPNFDYLVRYFNIWLTDLGVDQEMYDKLTSKL